jgi:cyclase
MKRILLLLIVMTGICAAQKEQSQIVQLSSNLFEISGLGGNVSFLVGPESVLVVDAGNSPSDGKEILRLIREKTDQPVKFLIITHYHPDHTNGMQAFPDGISIIGQKNLIANLHGRKEAGLKLAIEKQLPTAIEQLEKKIAELKMKKDSAVAQEEKSLSETKQRLEQVKQIKIIEPNITFEDKYSLVLGKDTVECIYPGPAHTMCNIVVYYKSQKILHTGDLFFNGSFPYIIWQDGINTKNWSEFLKQVSTSWNVDKIIPGHGPITQKKNMIRLSEYLYDLRAEVESSLKKGMSLDEMKKKITLEKYKDFAWPQLIAQNIESVYHEVGGK